MTPVKVIFFEAGIAGGSVNRLLTLLRRWDHANLPCAVVTFFNKKKAGQILTLDGPVWRCTFAFQREDQPDIFGKFAGVPLPTIHFLTYFARSITILMKNPDALVYINNTPYAHLPLIFAALVLRRKVVCHLRSMNLLTRLEKKLIPAFYRFIALTCAAKDHYITQGIPDNKIEVVYDSIDLSLFSRVVPIERSLKTPAAIVVGSLFFLKGQDICIKALALVRKKYPDARLSLVGEGYYEKELRDLGRSLGIEDCVSFLGYSDQIPEILAKHDIGILASRKEGMPNCVLEYMAAGLPVIVADLPGIRELVSEGESGYIVPQESPEELAKFWNKLLQDKGLRRYMGSRGKQIIEEPRFSPIQELNRIADIIKSCFQS